MTRLSDMMIVASTIFRRCKIGPEKDPLGSPLRFSLLNAWASHQASLLPNLIHLHSRDCRILTCHLSWETPSYTSLHPFPIPIIPPPLVCSNTWSTHCFKSWYYLYRHHFHLWNWRNPIYGTPIFSYFWLSRLDTFFYRLNPSLLNILKQEFK